jgi:TonB family protein
MFRTSLLLLVALFAPCRLGAQGPSDLDGAIHVGPGVKPPRLLRKAEPQYSGEARANHIQGTVVLQLAITEKGRPTGVTVISPLGFGLDERAKAAIERWEFAPGTKDGKPVKILSEVTINFRFPEIWFDEKAERRRTDFNLALRTLKHAAPGAEAAAAPAKTMQELSRQQFPPAMHLIGLWEIAGDYVAKDPADGLALVQKAAAKNYGPALYEVAARQIEGRDLPKDVEKGLESMRQASILGSVQAQFHLGNRYETGSGVPREPDRARRYFRLCAAQGVPLCQYRLGHLLLDDPGRPERDTVQAVAWLQLAAEQGIPEAKKLAEREGATLTPQQTTWVATLKAQLPQK